MGVQKNSLKRLILKFVQNLNNFLVIKVAEMMTPPELEAVRKIHQKLDNLSKAQIQADETLLLLNQYLYFKLIT